MEQLPILSDSLPIPRKSGIQIQFRQEHVREQGAERPSTSIASTADSIAISSKP